MTDQVGITARRLQSFVARAHALGDEIGPWAVGMVVAGLAPRERVAVRDTLLRQAAARVPLPTTCEIAAVLGALLAGQRIRVPPVVLDLVKAARVLGLIGQRQIVRALVSR